MGGAHAVAALAYGTETRRRAPTSSPAPATSTCRRPSAWSAATSGIDGFAGPVRRARAGRRRAPTRRWSRIDLAAQAEHGEGTIVCAVSDDPALLDAIDASTPGDGGGRARATPPTSRPRWPSPRPSRPSTSSSSAPRPRRWRRACAAPAACSSARESATAFGDYVAGSNHTLPTGGAARFASGSSPRHFRRRMSEVRIGPAAGALARAGAPIARAEGFERHAASMEVRENAGP